MKLSTFLKQHGACSDGVRWVRRLGFKKAYLAAKRSDSSNYRRRWLFWFCRDLSTHAELDVCWCQYCDGPPTYKVVAATLRKLK